MSLRDWPGLRRVFRIPLGLRRVRADVSAELGFHIEGRIDELMAHGMSRPDAEVEARRRFGDYQRIESEVERFDRGAQRRRTMADRFDALRDDVRYTIRSLVRQPVFAGVVIATLTLGIAATTAIFHAVDRIVLHPLPYPNPERIVYLGWKWTRDCCSGALSPRKFTFWQQQSRVFSGLATSSTFESTVGEDNSGPVARGMRITADYLGVIGMQPTLGRGFSKDEFRSDAPPVAILSRALWTGQFGGDPNAIGKTIRLNGHPYTIVGVMPASFEVAEQTEWAQVLLPFEFTVDQMSEGGNNYTVIGRLRDGATPAQIDADMAAVFERYRAAEFAQKDDEGVKLYTYQSLFTGADLSSALWIMFGATVFVLVLACANVTNLLLARALSRQREFAVRTALGAGRGRIARQVILEMVVLGLVSAAIATVASLVSVRGIVALANGNLLRDSQLKVDSRVLVYTTLIALAASLIVGLAVSLAATRVDLTKSLAGGGRGTSGGKRQTRLRSVLVSAESAIAMLLLAGAGLLIASFVRLSTVNPGFQTDGIFTATISHAPAGYDSAASVWQFEQRVVDRLRATPGIAAAGATFTLPLQRGWNLPMTVEGRPNDTETIEWRSMSPSYLQTMGIRLIAGRDILDSDNEGAPPVVIISQSFAKRYWPNQNPIGQRVLLGRYKGKLIGPGFAEPPREIIGVVPDLRDMSLDQTRMRRTAWVPQAQVPKAMAKLPAFVVRASDAGIAADALRRAISETDPRMRAPEIAAMTDIVSRSLSWQRFVMVLMSVFALIALALTCVGIYGVVAYSVAQRVHEIGVRMALGARPGSVVRLVVAQGVRPAIVGLIIGLGGALALSRLLAKMLYGVGPRDPLSLGVVAVVLAAVAMLASYLPARRASRVDPLTALRAD